jgi:ureidoacrylate peracid hydrolase
MTVLPQMQKIVSVPARPELVDIDLTRTAVIVVDMQNAFASKGGMFDLVGQDISAARGVIERVKMVTDGARLAGVKVIYLTMCYRADMSDSGGPGSPNWHKEFALVAMNSDARLKGKFLIKGSWDADIVDELKPQPDDIVVEKSRYSGFRGTRLDVVLKTYDLKYLIFTGIATNVCVESTLRDAFFLDYWPILVSDCTNNAGPPITQQATLWNVENVFGWVTTSEELITALSSK